MVLCSGKVRWDLVNKRAQLGLQSSVAILPMERLYPIAARVGPRARPVEADPEIRWVQDEPTNQGAWPFMALNLPGDLHEADPGQHWEATPVTRAASAAPSVGSAKVHEIQQRELLEDAFG